jgi:RNA polymerase sigma factor (sigma-70 family)
VTNMRYTMSVGEERRTARPLKGGDALMVTDDQIVEWRNAAYRMSRAVLHNREDAEDAAQETLIKLSSRKNDINPDTIGALVWRSARNQSVTHVRRVRSRCRLVQMAQDTLRNELVVSPDEHTQYLWHVCTAFEAMEPYQQSLVFRVVLRNTPIAMVAYDEGLSVTAIRRRLRKALLAMREMLSDPPSPVEML